MGMGGAGARGCYMPSCPLPSPRSPTKPPTPPPPHTHVHATMTMRPSYSRPTHICTCVPYVICIWHAALPPLPLSPSSPRPHICTSTHARTHTHPHLTYHTCMPHTMAMPSIPAYPLGPVHMHTCAVAFATVPLRHACTLVASRWVGGDTSAPPYARTPAPFRRFA